MKHGASWLTVWMKELFTFYHGIYFLMMKTNDRLSPYRPGQTVQILKENIIKSMFIFSQYVNAFCGLVLFFSPKVIYPEVFMVEKS
jgi:hypothetical protein